MTPLATLPCIGLFGTCGSSRWREPFIAAYEAAAIPFFNPQVEDWTPAHADIEADHLLRDQIVLFPVTGETYGLGSLAETGFSILRAVEASFASTRPRWVVVMIEPALADDLHADTVASRESLRARRLVGAHLAARPSAHVITVDSLDQMLAVSLTLYEGARTLDRAYAAGAITSAT